MPEPRDQEIKSYVEESLVIEVDEAAEDLGMSRSQMVRKFVRDGLRARQRQLRAVEPLSA